MKNRDITNREYLSPTEAAEYLGVCRQYIYMLISARKLTSSKLGTRTIIRKSNLDELVTAGEKGRMKKERKRRITKADANRMCGVE